MTPPARTESLPRLIERAAAALAKATTAAEVLDAKAQAGIAYTAAKAAAQFAKFKNAHDTVIAACHKAQADALVIEALAQCRLADEYDAAQERGEVGKRGDFGGVNSRGEFTPTAADIGLTSKQVHEARIMRDAEKKKPGIVRKTMDETLNAGEEPTRAALKRATASKRKQQARSAPTAHPKRMEFVALADQGLSNSEIAAETGISEHTIRREVEREQIKRETKPTITPDMLSMTAQEKLDAAIRQHKRQLDIEFEQRVRAEVARRIDHIILPEWQRQIKEAKELYDARRGVMDKATFNKIRRCLHADTRLHVSEGVANDAFRLFNDLEKKLLNEKESPTTFTGLPTTREGWDALKREAAAARKAKRGHSNVDRH